MEKSIIIAGAGMGGLAAGVYGRLNGYHTTIFEQHSVPGGQCASWKRHGYTFDGCIHHLFGTDPSSKLYTLWRELGAMPRELARTSECVSVASPDGKLFKGTLRRRHTWLPFRPREGVQPQRHDVRQGVLDPSGALELLHGRDLGHQHRSLVRQCPVREESRPGLVQGRRQEVRDRLTQDGR